MNRMETSLACLMKSMGNTLDELNDDIDEKGN